MKIFLEKNYRISSILMAGFITLALMQLSCAKEWLEKKPDIKATIPATLKDCQALLDNNSIFNEQCPALSEIATDGHYINAANIPTMAPLVRNAYTWSNDPAYDVLVDWNSPGSGGSYTRIFTANLILETLGKIGVDQSNKNEYNDIKGQALFSRAKAYYELAQLFAPPYVSGTANEGLGLPLRLESDINIPSVRATVQRTYDRIIIDLNEAKEIIAVKSGYKTRASKVAVHAMLARVYNGMGEYEKAGIEANEALNYNSALIDYNKLNSAVAYPVPALNEEVIFSSILINMLDNNSRARVDPALMALYHINDLRNTIFFTTSAGQSTFRGFYHGSRFAFNGLVTDELYLIRAESYVRANKIAEAMADINTLLYSRWKKINGVSTYINQTAPNAEEALKIVINERKKELLFRGLRWTDLRRLNRDPRFATTITRVVEGKTYTLEPNSYRYTFPLPTSVLQMTSMQQNIGW